MESSKLKNMVILRNLPSNIVDEAIIVLKSSKRVKKLQKVEKSKKIQSNESIKKDKDYILKEAEMLVNSYVSKIENKGKKDIFNGSMKEKYNKLKKYSIIVTVMCVIQAIFIIF